MKTPLDPRHVRRAKKMETLFRVGFTTPQRTPPHIAPHLHTIDQEIATAAPEWPLSKIAKIDLAILRLAVFELTVEKKEPPKVIIDEAVELAKSYGNDASASFVNGVLGTVMNGLGKETI